MHQLSYFILVLTTLSSCQPTSFDQDKATQEISTLLDEFLSKVDQGEMHDRFWAEDLIYTSSSGTRFGKGEIMSGFSESEEADEASSTPSVAYGSEDVVIRFFGETAVLTFTLVSETTFADSTEVDKYLNSGTLIKRTEEWKVVNWQATKMPKN